MHGTLQINFSPTGSGTTSPDFLSTERQNRLIPDNDLMLIVGPMERETLSYPFNQHWRLSFEASVLSIMKRALSISSPKETRSLASRLKG